MTDQVQVGRTKVEVSMILLGRCYVVCVQSHTVLQELFEFFIFISLFGLEGSRRKF